MFYNPLFAYLLELWTFWHRSFTIAYLTYLLFLYNFFESKFLFVIIIGGSNVLESSFFFPGNLYESNLLVLMLAPWLPYNKFYSLPYENFTSKSRKLFSSILFDV